MSECNKPSEKEPKNLPEEPIEEVEYDGIGEIPDEIWDQIVGQVAEQIKAGKKPENPS